MKIQIQINIQKMSSANVQEKLLQLRLRHIDVESMLDEELSYIIPNIISNLVNSMYNDLEVI